MGQEQSSQHPKSSAPISAPGVRLVQESANTSSASNHATDRLVDTSAALPLPQPLLPPAPIKDDVSSALQGAHVMHELRAVLGGLWLGGEESAPRSSPMALRPNASEEGRGESAMEDEGSDASLLKKATSIDEFSAAELSEADTRAEQERWARLGIDFEAVSVVLNECTGGDRLARALVRQEGLLEKIKCAAETSGRLRKAMDTNGEQAKRTTLALEGLDRIHVALADVQDNLESAVATANILGASHFSHDDEMCSFKNFLKHNPPSVV